MADRIDAILVKLGQPSGPAPLKRWLETLNARDGAKPPRPRRGRHHRSEHRRRARQPGPGARRGRADVRRGEPWHGRRDPAPRRTHPRRADREQRAHASGSPFAAAHRRGALHAVGAANHHQRGPDHRRRRRRFLLRPASPACVGHAAYSKSCCNACTCRSGQGKTGVSRGGAATPALSVPRARRQLAQHACGESLAWDGAAPAGHVDDLRVGQPIAPAGRRCGPTIERNPR